MDNSTRTNGLRTNFRNGKWVGWLIQLFVASIPVIIAFFVWFAVTGKDVAVLQSEMASLGETVGKLQGGKDIAVLQAEVLNLQTKIQELYGELREVSQGMGGIQSNRWTRQDHDMFMRDQFEPLRNKIYSR